MLSEEQGIDEHLTIGELSRLTGITTHTLRVWEKRYGAPISVRLPSGHRRYGKKEVLRLRAIAKALESGYRASKVVTGTLEELHKLLGLTHPDDEDAIDDLLPDKVIREWLDYVKDYDNEKLSNSFHDLWIQIGPLNFVNNYVGKFIKNIELGWQVGEISIAQEHFASEHISSFLSGKWRRLNQYNDGHTAILTTLPNDGCQLGLIMCAVVTTLYGFKVVFLGPNTPCEDIVSSVNSCNSNLVCVSITTCIDLATSESHLFQLRGLLNEDVQMVIGGAGSPNMIPGVKKYNNFMEFSNWLDKLKK
ncbi:MAG: hypothetical protein CL402_06060 [Acidiferrobacteraceae bacterium]|nr:hypothetical protein [Acidiferrobacteraceae bacterium]|tara:strand:- start:488 stop:1402 length:915 start_codon:yes stop_codon:yes gene_type:complete